VFVTQYPFYDELNRRSPFSWRHGGKDEDSSRVKTSSVGAVVGAVGIAVVGFSALGWTLGSTADRIANERAEVAVVAVLTPVCVAKFEAQADAATKLVEFKKVSTSWDQSSFIEKGGWATMPGSATPNSAVAHACAEKLGSVT
jgi:hypothetical protein